MRLIASVALLKYGSSMKHTTWPLAVPGHILNRAVNIVYERIYIFGVACSGKHSSSLMIPSFC